MKIISIKILTIVVLLPVNVSPLYAGSTLRNYNKCVLKYRAEYRKVMLRVADEQSIDAKKCAHKRNKQECYHRNYLKYRNIRQRANAKQRYESRQCKIPLAPYRKCKKKAVDEFDRKLRFAYYLHRTEVKRCRATIRYNNRRLKACFYNATEQKYSRIRKAIKERKLKKKQCKSRIP